MDFQGNCTSTTTETPSAGGDDSSNRDLKFLLVPLIVILLVMFLSALVYLMARRKRRLDHLRHNLLALYDFDSNEQEWESLNSNSYDNYAGYNSTNM